MDSQIPEYKVLNDDSGYKYELLEGVHYHSKRYGKDVILEKGFKSDGASGAFDIHSLAWWVHDKLCETGVWSDGTSITNWQASRVLSDILRSEGRWIRSWRWFWATWLFGCSKARKNGMW